MNKPIGKVRNPWVVLALMIVTMGIYGIFWDYFNFEELRNHRGQGWSGLTFLILVFIPPLQIVTIVIPWLLPAYIGRLYSEDNQQKPITGYTGFWVFLPLIGGIIWLFRVQNNLNRFWLQKRSESAS